MVNILKFLFAKVPGATGGHYYDNQSRESPNRCLALGHQRARLFREETSWLQEPLWFRLFWSSPVLQCLKPGFSLVYSSALRVRSSASSVQASRRFRELFVLERVESCLPAIGEATSSRELPFRTLIFREPLSAIHESAHKNIRPSTRLISHQKTKITLSKAHYFRFPFSPMHPNTRRYSDSHLLGIFAV